jgi:hypothetical protein
MMRLGWLARAAFVFAGMRPNRSAFGPRTNLGKARFIEGLPQLSGPVHSFCTNHFDFRFSFAMLVAMASPK